MRIRDIFIEKKDIASLDLINIISYSISLSKEKILMNLDMKLEEQDLKYINQLTNQRIIGKPLAYILEKKEFYSETFHVNQHVLIPRPETEMIVEEALKIIKRKNKTIRIMDMGTGSGAIGIILAKKTLCETVCVDISHDALKIARKNSKFHETEKNITYICSDLFEGIKKNTKFDLILANLPYISQKDWNSLSKDVKDFEPILALYGGETGMEIYKRFVDTLPQYLSKNAYVLCEIGNVSQVQKLRSMLESLGLNTYVKMDLSGRERIIVGS